MAAVARQIEIHRGDGVAVAVKRDVIVDKEKGVAAEVKTVVGAVDVGGGDIRLVEHRTITAVQVHPANSSSALGSTSTNTRPALTYTTATARVSPPPSTPTRRTSCSYSVGSVDSDSPDKICLKKSEVICTGAVGILVIGALFIGLSAVYLLPCSPLYSAGVSIITFGALTLLTSCCYCSFVAKKRGCIAYCRYFLIGFLVLLLLAVVIAVSVRVFANYIEKKEDAEEDSECKGFAFIIAIALASVTYAVLVTVSCFCCLHGVSLLKNK